jgi:hypothetical protein
MDLKHVLLIKSSGEFCLDAESKMIIVIVQQRIGLRRERRIQKKKEEKEDYNSPILWLIQNITLKMDIDFVLTYLARVAAAAPQAEHILL